MGRRKSKSSLTRKTKMGRLKSKSISRRKLKMGRCEIEIKLNKKEEDGETEIEIDFGPPGSGKGTHSPIIKDEFCLCHLATGDMLRVVVAAKTPIGIKAKETMEKVFFQVTSEMNSVYFHTSKEGQHVK